MKSKVVNINPHYVAHLIGPIALENDMEQHEDIFELLDLACKDHVKFLVDEIIQPEYLRLTDESRYKTKESLRYLLNTEPSGAVSHICSTLGLSDEEIPAFLDQLWEFLFPGEDKLWLPDLKYVKKSAPLRFNDVSFAYLPTRTFNESLEALRNRMNNE
ncbi:hypothetical protein [Massilia genomosp. 1]|uniref:Uncharacterized protein n=1 Tax=Massilia genomosp. 1 TaxID=2609280 RepID=A0ABX0MWB0_9BURK|nr:hypothetical protein [Massilia genomosp. 1]NHZ67052.1 hypothetical protein [Massilia genomosp. 1]